MPTKEELARWGRKGTRHPGSARSSSQAAPASQQALPPPPPGQAWSWHPTGMYVLVPIQAPVEPVRQPQNVRSYAPNPVTGYAQSPAPNNVIPFRQVDSCQLVPTGVDRFGNPVDGYADYLAGLPDLDPSAIAGRVSFDVHGLVPGEDDQARLEHLHHPADVSDRNPNAVARDPVVDARGSRGFLARRTSPYLVPGGAGPGGNDGAA